MRFFGIMYLVSSVFIGLFKKESNEYDEDYGLVDTYKLVWQIVSLAPIRKLAFILLTIRVMLHLNIL